MTLNRCHPSFVITLFVKSSRELATTATTTPSCMCLVRLSKWWYTLLETQLEKESLQKVTRRLGVKIQAVLMDVDNPPAVIKLLKTLLWNRSISPALKTTSCRCKLAPWKQHACCYSKWLWDERKENLRGSFPKSTDLNHYASILKVHHDELSLWRHRYWAPLSEALDCSHAF